MVVLTKYDQTEPIYLPQSVVTYISLHSVYPYCSIGKITHTPRAMLLWWSPQWHCWLLVFSIIFAAPVMHAIRLSSL
jgi:hypothetical protein